jgi:hypothetical protein
MKHDGLVVVLGIGVNQKDFIRRLKLRKYTICGFGKGRNDPEARNDCDYFFEVDTSHSDQIIKHVESIGIPVIGIGSFAGGKAIQSLQELERHFGVSTKIPKNISVGMDKLAQQVLYRQFDIGALNTIRAKDLDSYSSLNDTEYYIVKPSVGRGSLDIRIMTASDIKSRIQTLSSQDLVIQEYFVGTEYRVFALIQDKRLKLMCPIVRKSVQGSHLIGRLIYAPKSSAILNKYFDNVIRKCNLVNCVVKADILINGNEIRLIEMDIGVGGGEYFKKLISMIYSRDVTELYIDLILDKQISAIPSPINQKKIMDYFYLANGVYEIDRDSIQKFFKNEYTDPVVQFNALIPNQFTARAKINSDFIAAVVHSADIPLETTHDSFRKFMDHHRIKH